MRDEQAMRFSVVIPAFNESAYIGNALHSLSKQDFEGNFEIIVVDNNSTDDTALIARRMGAIVVEEPNPGVCQARQRGTSVARGEIVVSTDADTTFSPFWLTKIDRTFQMNSTCVAVAGPCRFMQAPLWGTFYSRLLFLIVRIVYALTRKVIYVTATNTAFRRDLFEGYDLRLTQGGDELDLLHRMQRKGRVVYINDNHTLTSSRRLNQGFMYNFFISFVYYYLLAYLLNRVMGRSILGTAPKFRGEYRNRSGRFSLVWISVGIGIASLFVVSLITGPSLLTVAESALHVIQREL